MIKSLPCAENFFLSLTNDIFVICDLKVIKNNRNTYHTINFDKKLPKKYSVHISGYIPWMAMAGAVLALVFKVFGGFKRVFLVLLTKESPYLSALKQELLDEI